MVFAWVGHKSDVLWWCIHHGHPPADHIETLVGAGGGQLLAPRRSTRSPHSLSSVHPHDLIPHPPRCAGRVAAELGRTRCVCPSLQTQGRLLGEPRRLLPVGRSCWDRLDSSGRLWSCRLLTCSRHPWFRSISFPRRRAPEEKLIPSPREGRMPAPWEMLTPLLGHKIY